MQECRVNPSVVLLQYLLAAVALPAAVPLAVRFRRESNPEREEMMTTDLIGNAAAFCTSISFLPRLIKAIRGHDTHSLSLCMNVIFTVDVFLWGL
jgi:hypothetical protein